MHKSLFTVGACLLLCACAIDGTPRERGEAVDVPERFQVLDAASNAPRAMDPGPACENPLIDPRDGTRLTLVRASGGLGDYEPAAARYGLAADELLRVDCVTGAPVGRVTR